jgi:sarcosine oxidase
VPTRRTVLKLAAAPIVLGVPAFHAQPRHVAVIGAGAFGGWTALWLARRGARVTIVDAWGPGNMRASSGGETRVIRATYGSRTIYTGMACRAMELWRANEAQWQRRFLRQTGVLWLFERDDSFRRASVDALRQRAAAIEEWRPADAARRYPQIAFDGIHSVMFEADAGYLLARRACEHVVERFVAAGGEYRAGAAATPLRVDADPIPRVRLRSGDAVAADAFVFACGPWLGSLFPDAVGPLIASTRQEVYYFGTPPGDERFSEAALPVWIHVGDALFYGIPGNANRGFKMADDAPGPVFDPTGGDRNVGDAGVGAARRFLAQRFPDLAGAPLLGSEVCQYESTPDSHFIVDRHPHAANVWIAGGGSGHGFKMGPVIGEMLAAAVLDDAAPEAQFSLARFAAPATGGWRNKWS